MRGERDVDYRRAEARAHWRVCAGRAGHGVARGPGRDPQREEQESDRSLDLSQERLSFPAGPAHDGRPAPTAARLPQAEGSWSVRAADQTSRLAPIALRGRGALAKFRVPHLLSSQIFWAPRRPACLLAQLRAHAMWPVAILNLL